MGCPLGGIGAGRALFPDICIALGFCCGSGWANEVGSFGPATRESVNAFDGPADPAPLIVLRGFLERAPAGSDDIGADALTGIGTVRGAGGPPTMDSGSGTVGATAAATGDAPPMVPATADSGAPGTNVGESAAASASASASPRMTAPGPAMTSTSRAGLATGGVIDTGAADGDSRFSSGGRSVSALVAASHGRGTAISSFGRAAPQRGHCACSPAKAVRQLWQNRTATESYLSSVRTSALAACGRCSQSGLISEGHRRPARPAPRSALP